MPRDLSKNKPIYTQFSGLHEGSCLQPTHVAGILEILESVYTSDKWTLM